MGTNVKWRLRIVDRPVVKSIIELLIVGGILIFGYAQLRDEAPSSIYLGNATSILLWIGLGYTIRLPTKSGRLRAILIYEAVAGLLGSFFITGTLFLFFLLQTPTTKFESLVSSVNDNTPLLVDTFFLGSIIMVFDFLLVRAARYGWPAWNRFRRKRVVWQLMHSHLTLISLVVVAFMIIVLFAIATLNDRSVLQDSLGSIPILLIITAGLGTVLSILVVLPFSIFSYSVARRITRRIDDLVEVTGILRNGDYRARVELEGDDEVTQLQSDFNAMAEALENTRNELETERDRVTKLLKSRRDLFASVSHDLRTPIAVLLGYIESAITRQQSTPSSEMHDDLIIMEREALRIQHLVDDLLTVARAETGNISFDMRPTNILPTVKHVTESASRVAWQKGKVQIIEDLPGQLPLVQIDVVRLEQILNNLVHNAIRHTPPGGLIVVSAHVEDRNVCISVKDTGEGIPESAIPHIWDRFYQISDSTRNSEGSGLGLTLVKQLTEAMDGKVAVESKINEGSSFTIQFPYA